MKLFPDSSKTTLRQMLKSGRVRVDGEIEKDARRKIAGGENVGIAFSGAIAEDRPVTAPCRFQNERPTDAARAARDQGNAAHFLVATIHSLLASAYGAAGSLVVFLVWVYYSAQIFLFGAEIIRVRLEQ